LLLDDGVITGVLDEERNKTVQADVVVLADESDPRLAEQVGLRPDWLPTELMHLCKELYPASTEVIDRHFRTEQGAYRAATYRFQSSWGAWGVGMLLPGVTGISVQVAMLLEDEMLSARHIKEYLDEFKMLPAVASLLENLRTERFFTEVVPVGGFGKSHQFHADGLLVVNDLLGLTHPMNRDGLSTNLKACAATAISITSAVGENDFSSRVLSRYSKQLSAEVIRPLANQHRGSADLRARPTWEWASLPSLLGPAEGVTAEDISETLPEVAKRTALRHLNGLSRRVGFRSGSRNVVDE
jgi:flavin-dependent dehydrogenase